MENGNEIDNSVSPADERLLSDDELQDLYEADKAPPEVVYSTQDFPVDGIVKRMNRKSMRVPQFGMQESGSQVDGFQRGFVWSKAQMDRFVESLLLGYPVPGIFLVKQADNVLLVLDGQQRIETLRRFYAGMHNDRAFKLENVGDQFKGLTYDELDDSLKFKLDDSFIHATVVVTDGSAELNDAIYGIFERLNSGGTQLTPHEIRVALYAGPLMNLVEGLNSDPNWRELYGAKNKRIRDHELVLRILALFLRSEEYSRPLKHFLNKFSSDYRDVKALPSDVEQLFVEAAREIKEKVGRKAFRRDGGPQLNAAQTEAVMVGTMKNIAEHTLVGDLDAALARLRENDTFNRSTTRATADNDSVRDRLRVATAVLGGEGE